MDGADRRTAEDAEDLDLAVRFAEGDESAFRRIVDRHGPWLYRLLFNLLSGSAEAAQDALQEVFCGLVQGLRRFRGKASLRTLLYRYARNKAADAVRAAAAERRKAAMRAMAPGRTAQPSAESEALERNEAAAVRRALGRLRADDRAILHLREFEGASMGEIAATLGIAEGAAKVRLHRARKRFAALWTRENGP
jgi:RNA polymerase sigma-70 factor (ECF subfamily)